MLASWSFTTAIALAFVAGCARQVPPVASAPATAVAPPSPAAPAPKRADDGYSLGSVHPGNQRALNAAAVPFATYLNKMHNRIHPVFADGGLARLDDRAPNDPVNDPKLSVRLEIVIDGQTGLLTKLVVLRSSGVTAFDGLAVESVKRVAPFDDAPAEIRSADGNVYVHWEFKRDEVFACSTMNARPFLLTTPPQQPPPSSLAL